MKKNISCTKKQCCGSALVSVRTQSFNDQVSEKIYSKNKYFFIKIAIYLFLGSSNYRRSLHPSKENIQHFKTWNFFTYVGKFCLPGSGSWSAFPMRFRPTKINANPCRSESTTLKKVLMTLFLIYIFVLCENIQYQISLSLEWMRIRDVYPGSRIQIFSIPDWKNYGSRIRNRIKEF